jgi:hypothetical protein
MSGPTGSLIKTIIAILSYANSDVKILKSLIKIFITINDTVTFSLAKEILELLRSLIKIIKFMKEHLSSCVSTLPKIIKR